MKRFISCLMVLSLLALGPSPALAKSAPGDFVDVDGHWAEKDITAVYNLGLMSGMGDNGQGNKIFAPSSTINRAQLAVSLQRTFELDYGELHFVKEPQASDYYQDVDNEAWYADAVTFCAINQVFDAGEKFYPDKEVTRIEMARTIYRCVNAKGLNIPMIMLMPYYKDMEGLSQDDTNALVFTSNTGLMKGDGQYWRPQEQIKRSELARVLNGLIKLIGVDESFNGKEYSIAPDNSFTLMLPSNSTTGYRWTASYDVKMLDLTGKYYQPDEPVELPGQEGMDFWRFKALQAGTTEIEMTYSRPWESVQPLKIFTLKVTIASDGAVQDPIAVNYQPVKEKSDIMETDLSIPVVSGQLDAKVQSAINKRFEEDAMELKKTLETEIRGYAKESEAAGYPVRPYQLVTRCRQCYLNDNILSLYVDYYQYTGGAHGLTNRQDYNIDLKTGELIPLAGLFKPDYDYKSVIDQEITRQITAQPEMYFDGDMGFNGISNEQRYYLDGANLVVYFNQYDIAPYAAGIPEFKIPFALFNGGYQGEILG